MTTLERIPRGSIPVPLRNVNGVHGVLMLFNLTMFPIGASDAIARPVAEVIEEIASSALPYSVNGAATVIEGDWDRVLPVIHRAFTRLRASHDRVYIVLTIDDHASVRDRMHEAVADVERELGHHVPH